MSALEQVVLYKLNGEKGEGATLRKEMKGQLFPTFVLMNATGGELERWVGYEKEMFRQKLGTALADPTTMEQKLARFHESPSAQDAETLARFHLSSAEYGDAAAMYRRAAELDADKDYVYEQFEAAAYGYETEEFTTEQVQEAAQTVMASEGADPQQVVDTYFLMRRVEAKSKQPGLATPFIEPALAAAETDEELAKAAKTLRVEHALRIDQDADKAYELKLASMPGGWKDDPKGLNSVAWWCFENHLHLEEAEVLARRGSELAPAGSERAMILDTAAEICNARGNCNDAVQLMQEAIENHPESEYYKKQLVRFRELAAAMN